MEEKKPIFKRPVFWVIIAVLAIAGYGSSLKKNDNTEAPAKIAETAEPTAKPTAQPTAKPTPTPTIAPTVKPTAKPTVAAEREYVLNTSSMKFHKKTCDSVKDIDPSNKKTVTTTRDKLIAQGYEPCKRCYP